MVQAALYVATPPLAELVAAAIAACAAPRETLKFLCSHLGVRVKGHPGITRMAQIEGLTPYVEHLDWLDIERLWELCNERGWFEVRRRHLDPLLRDDRRSAAFLDDGRAMAALDDFADEGRPYRVDHWTSDFLQTGRSADSILSVVIG